MASRGMLVVGAAIVVAVAIWSAPGAAYNDRAAPGPARGHLLVVAPEGNDANPCTVPRPCLTFQHAANVARPGDQVWALAGVYQGQGLSGNASSPVAIRGVPGADVVIEGDIDIARPMVSLESLAVKGVVSFHPGSTGSSLFDSQAQGFNIFGADGIVLSGNVFDGQGIVPRNVIWDQPAGDTPDGWQVTNNTFRNYYDDADAEDHTEALYVGYSTNGLIAGNTFTNNGNTSHVFFTWFGTLADPSKYPQKICVRTNKFGPTHGAFYAVGFREEIPTSAGIRVDPSNVGATSTSRGFDGSCGSATRRVSTRTKR